MSKMDWDKFFKKHGIVNNKAEEIIVPVQTMFPNCQKYHSCCIAERERLRYEVLKNSGLGKKAVVSLKTRKIDPVDVNPFPEEDVVGVIDQ